MATTATTNQTGTTPLATVAREQPSSRYRPRVTVASAAAFVVLFAMLHLLRRDLNPTWRFPSEYALGSYGWMMVTAFIALALATFTLARTVGSYLTGWRSVAGQAALMVSAVGLLIASVFTTDPSTTPAAQFTSEGKIHGFGATLLTVLPIAIIVLTWAVHRTPAYRSIRRRLTIVGAFAVVASITTAVALAVLLSRHGGQPGPGVRAGWFGRVELLADSTWLAVFTRTLTSRPDTAIEVNP